MERENFDAVLVYADREHSANLAWCTGFDPRFEEALLLLTREGGGTLILGNECINVVSNLTVALDTALCQEFSLMGQDRSIAPDLAPVLKNAGLSPAMRCGVAGWKTMAAGRLEVPLFVAAAIESACGKPPESINDWFMHPRDGFRITNEPEQIAFFEYAACRTSAAVHSILRSLEPGRTCAGLSDLFLAGGLPHSCHPMLACGDPLTNGMASPGNDPIREGHFLNCAFGIWGALTCRAGLLATGPDSLRSGKDADTLQLLQNYLQVISTWYRAAAAGRPAGDIWREVDTARDDGLYTFCVNPGHYIHLDEWVSSPFFEGSDIPLPSGCALQVDIIPVSRKPGISVNMEDGIVLADAALRDDLEQRFPDMMARCRARRDFMTNQLGYQLAEDILPMGNLAGACFPCLLDTTWVCHH